jgi:hypothetical protein
MFDDYASVLNSLSKSGPWIAYFPDNPPVVELLSRGMKPPRIPG